MQTPLSSKTVPKRDIDLTLIAPCYNEEHNIRAFYQAVQHCFRDEDILVECVFVDDGSKDNTATVLKSLINEVSLTENENAQAIILSRNFGKEAALYAGLEAARGEACCFIDCDLQQQPSDALRMYRMLTDSPNCDIVAASQVNRKEGALLKAFKWVFYRAFNSVADEIDLPADISDFRVFRKTVREALLSMPEADRFGKGLFAWVGFSSKVVTYEPSPRVNGTSGWSFKKLLNYAVGGIFSFTTWPLKIAVWLGAITSMVAILYLLAIVTEYVIAGIDVPGYPTLACLVLLLGGLQLFVLGIIGEYIARGYIDGKRRPIYIARERLNSNSGSLHESR